MAQVHLFYPLLFLAILVISIVLIFVIARAFKDKLDNKKDIHFKDKDFEITQKIIEYKNKYPDVELQYILKPDSEKAIENCQEIHEQTEKIDALNDRLDKIEYYIKQLNIFQSMSLTDKK